MGVELDLDAPRPRTTQKGADHSDWEVR
jgi:hypothetical protein